MNCENCRWCKTIYNTFSIGNWVVYHRCLLGGCDGSQYEADMKSEDPSHPFADSVMMGEEE